MFINNKFMRYFIVLAILSPPVFAVDLTIPTATNYEIPKAGVFDVTIPAVPKVKAILEIRARIHYADGGAGSNTVMEVKVNNQQVKAEQRRGLGRLVNKSLFSRVTPNALGDWYLNGNWRLLYQSSFTTNATFYEGDPFSTQIDVTDLLNNNAPNNLKILNHVALSQPNPNTNESIIIDRVVLHYQTSGSASPTLLSDIKPSVVIKDGSSFSRPASYHLTKHSGGGFSIDVGTKKWNFTTAISYPNVGFNTLDPSGLTTMKGQPGWTTSIIGSGAILATGPSYKVTRVIRETPTKVIVTDKITNLLQVPIGLVVRNEVSLKGAENRPVRLAGSADLEIKPFKDSNFHQPYNDVYSPGNPTVYVESTNHGLGLVAEDDVYRNQARLYVKPGEGGVPMAGIKADMLRLAPGESYTLLWSVYPVQGYDYFDFINLVRKAWQANILTDGPWLWGYTGNMLNPSSTDFAALTKILLDPSYNIKYGVHGSWIDPREPMPRKVAFGAGMFDNVWDSYRADVASGNRFIREKSNNRIKALVYFDEQRDSSLNNNLTYQDSLFITNNGLPELPLSWKDQVNTLPYSMVPITGTTFGNNSFGTKMLSLPAKYRDELSADGLYIDEFEDVAYGNPRLIFNKTDQRTCLLDPYTLAIKNDQVGLTKLLSKQHHDQLISAAKNGSTTPNILANGPSYVKSSMNIQRMVETQHNNVWPYQGHLQTPLGYLAQSNTFADIQRLLTFGLLPVGTISTNWPAMGPAMALMFPTTPIELHMGYIFARERIITAHSGTYGWSGSFNLVRANFFDSEGNPTVGSYSSVVNSLGLRTTVNLPTKTTPPPQVVSIDTNNLPKEGNYIGHLAILRTVPITVNCTSCVISNLGYGTSSISITVSGDPSSLTVKDGEFRIKPGQLYKVVSGMITTLEKAQTNGELVIPVSPGSILITPA